MDDAWLADGSCMALEVLCSDNLQLPADNHTLDRTIDPSPVNPSPNDKLDSIQQN